MKDQDKTKKQVIDELNIQRRRTAELEELTAHYPQGEDSFPSLPAEYRAVLDSLSDAIHVIDSDFRLILVNRKFERWNGELGLDTQMIGKDLFEVFHFHGAFSLSPCER